MPSHINASAVIARPIPPALIAPPPPPEVHTATPPQKERARKSSSLLAGSDKLFRRSDTQKVGLLTGVTLK
jgi:hypothetical protein